MNKFERAFIDGFVKAAGGSHGGMLESIPPVAAGTTAGIGGMAEAAPGIPNVQVGAPPLPGAGMPPGAAPKPSMLSGLVGKAKGAMGRNPKTSIIATLAAALGVAGFGSGMSGPSGAPATPAGPSVGPMQGPPTPLPKPPQGADWLEALKKNMGDNKLAWGAGLGSAGLLGGAGLAHAMSPDKEKEQQHVSSPVI